jgi:hypothetical protein
LREHIAADAAEVASEEDGGINEEGRHFLETGLPTDVTTWGCEPTLVRVSRHVGNGRFAYTIFIQGESLKREIRDE